MQKECLNCGNLITGRIDKKYCDDLCRNAYHNDQNRDTSKYVRQVSRILMNNRRILFELNPDDKSKTTRSKLLSKGFDFNYFTNIYTTKAGAVYYFCYEKGYLALENEWYMLVTNLDVAKQNG